MMRTKINTNEKVLDVWCLVDDKDNYKFIVIDSISGAYFLENCRTGRNDRSYTLIYSTRLEKEDFSIFKKYAYEHDACTREIFNPKINFDCYKSSMKSKLVNMKEIAQCL